MKHTRKHNRWKGRDWRFPVGFTMFFRKQWMSRKAARKQSHKSRMRNAK